MTDNANAPNVVSVFQLGLLGWRCPACNAVNAPHIAQCPCLVRYVGPVTPYAPRPLPGCEVTCQ